MALRAESSRLLSHEDLASFPDDGKRREIIDGVLFVSPSPLTRHQMVSMALSVALFGYAQEHGGVALAAPMDLKLAKDTVVQPDVMLISAANLGIVSEKCLTGPPDLVVEISSPSTRRLELIGKLELYERFQVPVYWYVDLDAERVEVYELVDGRYGDPAFKRSGDLLEPVSLPGLSVPVEEILPPGQE